MADTTRRTDVMAGIAAYLAERFPQVGAITEETPLLSSGVIDSLGALDLMMHVAKVYQLPIDDMDLTAEVLETPGALTDFVLSRTAVVS